jgi:hypothetical protein
LIFAMEPPSERIAITCCSIVEFALPIQSAPLSVISHCNMSTVSKLSTRKKIELDISKDME